MFKKKKKNSFSPNFEIQGIIRCYNGKKYGKLEKPDIEVFQSQKGDCSENVIGLSDYIFQDRNYEWINLFIPRAKQIASGANDVPCGKEK